MWSRQILAWDCLGYENIEELPARPPASLETASPPTLPPDSLNIDTDDTDSKLSHVLTSGP